jgi:quinol monooxygenase YgiN
MADVIVEYIRYRIAADRRPAFERAYEDARKILERSEHCLSYEMTRCTEEPTSYVVRIEWDSIEGHLQGFRRHADFRTFLAGVGPFVQDIQEMRHYEVIS